MTRIEKYNEQIKLEKDYYYGDYIENDYEFCFEEAYIDAYLAGDEVIVGNFY